MSDHFLVVIPKDPHAPLPRSVETLRSALAKIAGTSEARAKDYGKLQFIGGGENADEICCPDCGANLDLEVWHTWMDADWQDEDGFHLNKHLMPCCSARVTLNALQYVSPQGFAHWFVSARNPGRGPLTAIEIDMLEAIAGVQLRAISQMY